MLHINKGAHWSTRHEHATVAEARECEAVVEQDRQEAEAEIRAERAGERFFEEGPESFRAMRWEENQEDERRWNEMIQEREAEQERAAYAAKMERDRRAGMV